MKRALFYFALLVLAGAMIAPPAEAQTAIAADSTYKLKVFEASTPCDAWVRSLLQIPAHADCEFIRWQLSLYQNPQTQAPTTFHIVSVYGLPQQGTNGFIQGGTQVEVAGRWVIMKGTKIDQEATVYQLKPDHAQHAVSFLKVDDRLLHVLSPEKRLMIGNAAWSYTFNQTQP